MNRSSYDVVDSTGQLHVGALNAIHFSAGGRRVANAFVVDWAGEQSAAGIVAWSFAHLGLALIKMKLKMEENLQIHLRAIFSVGTYV